MLVSQLQLDQDAVIRSAYGLPALPQSTVRLASIVANDNVDLSDVVQVIECDPALTLKLLRVANSVYSSSSRTIGEVKDAVIRLGSGAVLGLAIGSCIQPNIASVIPGYHLSGRTFWSHSLAAAMTADILRSFTRKRISSLAFTAALLHDIGKVVLGNFLNDETLEFLARAQIDGKQSAFAAEAEILSLQHAEVGALIAQHWGLPEPLVLGIGFHHTPESCDNDLVHVTHFANAVAHRVITPGEHTNDEQVAVEQLDLTKDLKRLGLREESTNKIVSMVKERLAAVSAEFI
ncbi:HDOD domain-containing protein [Schlesneria paludicola]|uniref:HDOD domain-containing protein n=1 Tax=Schlesneria paludicola TaxID=360056 RepID=UPI00029B3387|nr:HDOD domain-containing protein [Schlesneria paludicola]